MNLSLILAACALQLSASADRFDSSEPPRLRPLQRAERMQPRGATTKNHTTTTSVTPTNAALPPTPGLAAQPLVPPSGPGVTLLNGAGNGHDFGYDVVSDGLGNIYAQGVEETADGDDDFLTVKFDADGNEVWRRTFDGSSGLNDTAFDLRLDPSGNVLVAGRSAEVGTGNDITVLKYDGQGILLWDYHYNGPAGGSDGPGSRSLVVDSAGNAVVAGLSWGGAIQSYDAVLIKVSPLGELVWERRFNGVANSFDEFYGLAIDAQDNLYAGGGTYSSDYAFLIQKYDPAGTLLWEQQYDSPGGVNELLYSISLDSQSNVLVTGLTDDPETDGDYLTVKYDSAGNLLWSRPLDGGSGHGDIPFWAEAGPNGEVAVVGISQDASFGSSGLVVMYDALGNLLWQERVAGDYSGLSWLTDAKFTPSGDLLIAGRLDGLWISSSDAMLRRYTPDGTLLEQTLFDNACHAFDFLNGIHVDPVGDVFGIGYSQGSALNVDMALHRFQ